MVILAWDEKYEFETVDEVARPNIPQSRPDKGKIEDKTMISDSKERGNVE